MSKSLLLPFLFFFTDVAFAARLSEEAPRVGYVAPKFESRTLAGTAVRSTEYKERVVLVNFWASWCEPCTAEFPDLAKLQASFPVTQFTVVTLSQDTELEDVSAFLKERPVSFPVLIDDEQKVSRAYKVRGLPVSFLVGKDGVIVDVILGPREWASKEWTAKIRKLIDQSKL